MPQSKKKSVKHTTKKSAPVVKATTKHVVAPAQNPAKRAFTAGKTWVQASLVRLIFTSVTIILTIVLSCMFAVAQWYIHKHQDQPFALGATFVPDYARYFELDPHDTLEAMLKDLGVRHLRLVSYWNNYEPVQGQYNFDELDMEFKLAEQYGAKVSLAIGLRQPRWPECHMPDWAAKMPKEQWAPALKTYMGAVINRYHNSPVLESYQLENEYFLDVFGICPDFSRERLVDEFNFVKAKDPNHTLIVSMSNNAIGTPLYEPTPDVWAISVYKRVWDKTLTHRYFEYPIPAWYYAFRAGWVEMFRHHDAFIHELQTEPWAPEGIDLKMSSLEEQNKSMNADILKDRIEYGRATGMNKVDLWGAEWWYWRKEKKNDPSLWNVAKEQYRQANAHTGKYETKPN